MKRPKIHPTPRHEEAVTMTSVCSGAGSDDLDPIDNSHGFAIEPLPDDSNDPERLMVEMESGANTDEYDDGPPPVER